MNVFQNVVLMIAVVFAFNTAPVRAQNADQPAKPATAEKAAKPLRTAKSPVTGKLNINKADPDQIAMLPGVSPKQALSLFEFRWKNGDFKSFDDFKKVPGLKPKKFIKIKDYIIFEGETTLKPVQ